MEFMVDQHPPLLSNVLSIEKPPQNFDRAEGWRFYVAIYFVRSTTLWAVVPFSILNISHLAAGFKKKTQYAFWQSLSSNRWQLSF